MSKKLNPPIVILLHGLGRTPASMAPLAWRLRRAGRRVSSPGYPSTRDRVAASVEAVRRGLAQLEGPLDLVGHSLGGLIAARLMREAKELDIHRVVQLGTPNLGSPLAERLGGRWPVRRMCGPALQDLRPRTDAPEVDHRIGAIAGTWGLPGVPLPHPHDGAVSVRSAWAGAGHRTAVPALHTLLPASLQASRRVIEFLETGRFADRS